MADELTPTWMKDLITRTQSHQVSTIIFDGRRYYATPTTRVEAARQWRQLRCINPAQTRLFWRYFRSMREQAKRNLETNLFDD